MVKRSSVLRSLTLCLLTASTMSVAVLSFTACSQARAESVPMEDAQYDAQLKKAQQLSAENNTKEAIREYQSLVKQLKPIDGRTDERLIPILVSLGLCLESDGQKEAALEAYERCLNLAIREGGEVYNNYPKVSEAAPRAAILRSQLGGSYEKAKEDFEFGVKALVKYGQNISLDLKEKFLKTYEDYILKEKGQAEAERISSIALAIFRVDNGQNILKSKGDKWTGLIAAADIFVNPSNLDSGEMKDSEAVDWLLNEALKASTTQEQKDAIALKRAELTIINGDYDIALKELQKVKTLSKDLSLFTPQQKFSYWRAKAKVALKKEEPQPSISAITELLKLSDSPGATFKAVNYYVHRAHFEEDGRRAMVPTLKSLMDATAKVDGQQSWSYGRSLLNYALFISLGNNDDSAKNEAATCDMKAVEIMSKLPDPEYHQLATAGVNAGGDLLSLKRYQDAANLLEITLEASRKADEETIAAGETPNNTNCSPRSVENLLASAYAELKQFDKINALSKVDADTAGGDSETKASAGGAKVDEGASLTALLRKAYTLEEQKDPDYHAAEAAYDQASVKLLALDDFSNHPGFAYGPHSADPFGCWTSQHVPPGLIGFYERLGRFDKIAPFTAKENKGNWQLKGTGQYVLASCYLLAGEFDRAKPILTSGYTDAPPYSPPQGDCGTGMPVMKDSFARGLVVMNLDGYRDGKSAESLYDDQANGLAKSWQAEDLFNKALALDLQKKYEQSKPIHERILKQDQVYMRVGLDRKADLDAYRVLAFKPDRSIEETAQLMECFAWLHELPETTLNTAADRSIVYRRKHLGANRPETLDALKRIADRCVEIKKQVKFADCRSIKARFMRLLDEQERMNVDKAQIETTRSALKSPG